MDTEEIIWIVVAVVVVLALAALAWTLMRRSRLKRDEERRARAAELRNEASREAQVLPDAELRAQEERLKAERLRLDAEHAGARAEEAETRYLQQAAKHEDRIREADRIDPDAGAPGTHRRDHVRGDDVPDDTRRNDPPGAPTI